jgi:hypothetical protein
MHKQSVLLLAAACLTAGAVTTLAAGSPASHIPAGTVVVQPKFGGYMVGFGIDPAGKEGLLSEYVALQNGKNFIATETFDQKSGKILSVLAKRNNTMDSYATWGVFGQHVGLDEYYQARKQTFPVLAPLDGNSFNAAWKLSVQQDYYLSNVVGNFANSDVAVLTYSFSTDLPTVFASNIAANTFGTQVTVNDEEFCDCESPVIALDDAANEAVLSSSYGETPEVAIADLASGNVTEFTGVGYGFVSGIAVDGKSGIAVTTTGGGGLEPAGVEFYNLNNQTGTEFFLPCSDNGSPDYFGLSVAFDPIHSLFFVEQYQTTCSSGTAIDVYDESGNLQEMLTQFSLLPVSPTPIALNPRNRTGFIYQDRTATTLQSFTY